MVIVSGLSIKAPVTHTVDSVGPYTLYNLAFVSSCSFNVSASSSVSPPKIIHLKVWKQLVSFMF